MPRKKMLWQLILPYLSVIILSLVAITWYSFNSLRDFYLKETSWDLQSKAFLMQKQFAELLLDGEGAYGTIDSLCKSQGMISQTRLTVMLPSGVVVGDSEEEPVRMENHGSREEMRQALTGEVGKSVRYSNTIQQRMIYLAVPIFVEHRLVGVIRTSVSIASIENTLNELIAKISVALLIIIALASIISSVISKRISRPLEELKQGAEKFARGEFQYRLMIPDSEEIGRLAEAMNLMASQLDERIKTITSQRNEQQAILASMVEGVIAIDIREHIININEAAANLLNVSTNQVNGRPIQEIIRNHELELLIKQTLASDEVTEDEITLINKGEMFVQVNGSVLNDADGKRIGALIVLNDLTRLRRLENVRTDFVANVSHELKTPITSIKGFVETLLDGALENKEEAERFLRIINKQADRLNAIINDLLSLSTLEQEAKKGEISFEEADMCELMESVRQICQHKADAKQIKIELNVPLNLLWRINAPLLEQALINLLDNAIKYSPGDSMVRMSAEIVGKELLITCQDEGPGIAQKHQSRVFERFYRVDKGRSRDIGGTGLGLAIVKHIAITHGGKVSVQSELGSGSRFTITLPR